MRELSEALVRVADQATGEVVWLEQQQYGLGVSAVVQTALTEANTKGFTTLYGQAEAFFSRPFEVYG